MARWAAAVLGLGLLAGCSGSSATRGSAPPPALGTTTSAGGGTSSSTSAAASVSTTTTTPVDRCTAATSQITQLDARAATGHALRIYAVTNTSPRPCRISGYPAVTVRDGAGRTIAGAQPKAGFILPDRPPTAVVVAAGRAAYFGIESTSVCAGDDAGARSDSVGVTLPDDTTLTVVAEQLLVCTPSTILVSAVRATQADITRP